MRYEVTMVALLDTPAVHTTRTPFPCFLTSSISLYALAKKSIKNDYFILK